MSESNTHEQRPDAELMQYSTDLCYYLNRFVGEEKFSYILQKLEPHLTEDEKAELNTFYIDPITHEVMDIPVLLNDVFYDLDTLLKLPRKETPVAREPFEYKDIESSGGRKADLLSAFIERVSKRLSEENEA